MPRDPTGGSDIDVCCLLMRQGAVSRPSALRAVRNGMSGSLKARNRLSWAHMYQATQRPCMPKSGRAGRTSLAAFCLLQRRALSRGCWAYRAKKTGTLLWKPIQSD
ncbi:unnamed protein product [Symbiodinium pilosum]|uniref:Uncharacterized protein n=1 Tax=Symbiodinium pilosum TaxID=2952 RepID=A0A812QQN7_SYMPI|nr:unnamed protein product [Symbiodinium pilosum]